MAVRCSIAAVAATLSVEEVGRRMAAEQVPFPEYLTKADKTRQMATWIVGWLNNDASYHERLSWLAELNAKYGSTGASSRAADYMVEVLSGDDVAKRAA